MKLQHKHIHAGTVAAALLLLGWFLIYSITSSDFWWHVKAGQILRSEGWIHTDPFAHSREGLPYLASQSWLAQIVLSFFYDAGGAWGVYILRFLLVGGALGTLLLIDRKHIWPNAFAALLGVILMRSFLLDRPQLWTFLCFSLQLFIVFKFAWSPNKREETRSKNLFLFLLPLWGVQVLWVNMHGAAALVSTALPAAFLLEEVLEGMRSKQPLSVVLHRSSVYSIALVGLLLALLLSPNGLQNLTYLQNLFSDRTKEFIQEWQAPALAGYLQVAGIFWVLALGSILFTRKHYIASMSILLAFGIFATTAVRHLPLFVLCSLGIIFVSLRENLQWNRGVSKVLQRPVSLVALSAVVILALISLNTYTRSHIVHGGAGRIGTLERYAGAYDFLETWQPTGNMFNSFDAGGYLLYRGYPDRKIFIDGRNVDFGYDFLKRATDAAQNPDVWQELEDAYNLTYAVFNYAPDVVIETENTPYASHLDSNLRWALVYVDDDVAVYVKRIPEHAELIAQNEYALVTPGSLDTGAVFEGVTQQTVHELERELARIASADEKGVKALLLLGKLYYTSNLLDDTLRMAEEAMRRQPLHFGAYELAGQVYEKAGQYEKAVEMYEQSMKYSRHLHASYDYAHFADVWEKAGYPKKAEQFRKRAQLQSPT